ncbi:MAG TPA: hypothetical protein VF635_17845 [Propionibacteriaceae bacterium]
MTQPPYVPPRDDEGTTSSNPTWPAAQNTPVYDYSSASSEPTYGDSLDESVSSVSVGSGYDSTQSSTDVAKDQAAGVKNTAVEQGQQVAGVAKEQAGAVKDTAVGEAQHVAGVAKEQAGAVKDTAIGEAQHVAGVAKDQVAKVATEASTQFKDLLSEGLAEVRSAAGSQQKRLAGGVHSLAAELGSMASKSDQTGPLTNYAHEASRRGGELAHWLENAEPSEILDMLRSFARRRPWAFLGASALSGAVVGRLTRNLAANAKGDSSSSGLGSSYSSTSSFGTETASPSYGTQSYDTPAYDSQSYVSRDNISSQDVSASGSGYASTTGASDYLGDDATTPYGGTGGVTR